MLTIGKKIKTIREDNKLSQRDFADKLNVSAPYLSALENDKKEITSKIINKLHSEFNVSSDWLLFSNDNNIIKSDKIKVNQNDNNNDNLTNEKDNNLNEVDFSNNVRKIFNNRELLIKILSKYTDIDKLNLLYSGAMKMESYFYKYFDNSFLDILKTMSYDETYKKDVKKLLHVIQDDIQDFNNLLAVYSPIIEAIEKANTYFEENYDRLGLYNEDFLEKREE